MATPLLVAQNQNTTAQVGYIIGTDYTQLGDDLPSLETSTTDHFLQNRAIYAWGGVYALHREGLYKLQTGSNFGAWSKDPGDGGIDFANFPILGDVSGTDHHGGVYFTVLGEDPYLCGWIWSNSATFFRAWRYNLLTGTPEVGSNIGLGAGPTTPAREVFYNGQIYVYYGDFNRDWIINPSSLSGAFSTPATVNGAFNIDHHVFQNRLFAAGKNASNIDVFCEIIGTNYVELFTLSNTAASPTARRNLLFDNGTSMFVVWYNSTAVEWQLRRILFTAGIASLDATALTLPEAIRTSGANARLWANKVYNADGTTDILIYHNTNATTTTYAQYIWDDTNLTMILQDSGGINGYYSVPHVKNGSGDRTYIAGMPTASVYRRQRVAGGEKVTFRVFPPVDTVIEGLDLNDLIVRFYFDTEQGVPETQALLTGTATGGSAVRNGNDVINVSADGTTDYTITIQAIGFGDNDKLGLVAEVS